MDWQIGHFGIGREITPGQGVSPSRYYPVRHVSFIDQRPPLALTPVGLAGKIIAPSQGIPQFRGETDVTFDSLGCLLTAAYGMAESIPHNSHYKHTFKPGQTYPSYTFELAREGVIKTVVGGYVTNFALNITPGGRMTATFDGGGMDWSNNFGDGLNYLSSDTSPTPMWSQVQVRVNTVTETRITNVTFSLRNPWVPLVGFGISGRPSGFVLSGQPESSLSFALTETTSLWVNYAKNQTELSFTLQVSPTGASSSSLEITFPKTRLNDSQHILAKASHSIPVQAVAFGTDSAPTGAVVTLINQVVAF